jgi:hypothetical protein
VIRGYRSARRPSNGAVGGAGIVRALDIPPLRA